MSGVQRVLILVLAAVALGLAGWRTAVWRDAAAKHARAAAERATITQKSARIAELRARPAVSGFGAKPVDDVMPLANRVLEAAHLPSARLRSVQPEADRAIADDRDGLRASSVRLTLEPLTVQELGAFLMAWRSMQLVWSVSRIDLSAMMQGNGAGGGLGSPKAGNYRASMTVSATYLDDLPGAAQTTDTAQPAAHFSPLLGPQQ